ncbi:MAG: hypothetical protein L3K26_15205, partial [Candidatus Hydrogenedentes bacterium]|nr:hypothetical protein [Candidatus Hydrogenedentota bacterium]
QEDTRCGPAILPFQGGSVLRHPNPGRCLGLTYWGLSGQIANTRGCPLEKKGLVIFRVSLPTWQYQGERCSQANFIHHEETKNTKDARRREVTGCPARTLLFFLRALRLFVVKCFFFASSRLCVRSLILFGTQRRKDAKGGF